METKTGRVFPAETSRMCGYKYPEEAKNLAYSRNSENDPVA